VVVAVGAWALLRPRGPSVDVLVITIDTLRADALTPEDMPALADAAARGTRFVRARAPAPLTLPSHTTLLSGVLPPVHGIHDNTAAPLPDPAGRAYPLLAEDFHEAGYATGAIVASSVLDPRYRLDQGFDEYRHPPRAPAGTPVFGSFPAEEQVQRVRAWLDARTPGRPFFLWVHLWDPHAPYEPYPGDARGRKGTYEGDSDRERYLGEVRRADAAIEAILGMVDPDRTVIVIASDHGESLGEHGEASHGYLCYGATMDVPLVLLGPGVPAGVEDDRVAGLEDVAPTLRKLAGLEPGRGDGRDLLARPAGRIAVGESLYAHRLYGWAQQTVAFDGRYSLVDGGPRLGLFDRAADPGELAPIPDPAALPEFEELDRALQTYRDRRGPEGRGTELSAAPIYYGVPLVPTSRFLPVAENRRLREVREALPDAMLLDRVNGAIHSGGRQLVVALLPALEDLQRRDPANPAPCLARGRALLLGLGDAKGAVEALEEAVLRGYDSMDVDRLLERAALAAGDEAALARARSRIAEREKAAPR